MDEQQRIKRLQRSWAAPKGLKFDSEGYLPDVESNLRTPLSPCARADFSKGAGSELARNMRALHSSPALVANYFDFWTNRAKGPLLAALGVGEERVESLRFERRFPTGLRGTPPHVDVTLALAVGGVVAIESKFTEHLSLSSRGRNNFAPPISLGQTGSGPGPAYPNARNCQKRWKPRTSGITHWTPASFSSMP